MNEAVIIVTPIMKSVQNFHHRKESFLLLKTSSEDTTIAVFSNLEWRGVTTFLERRVRSLQN